MKIKANDIVAMLKKLDEIEEKAGRAFSSCEQDDLQSAVEKMRELRAMLYSLLAAGQEEQNPVPSPAPCPVTYPVIVPFWEAPWWETTRITCASRA